MKKQAVLMKQAVAPLQATEVGIIRRKLTSFDVKQHEFREKFRQTAPFEFDAKLDDVYSRIDKVRPLCAVFMYLYTYVWVELDHSKSVICTCTTKLQQLSCARSTCTNSIPIQTVAQ